MPLLPYLRHAPAHLYRLSRECTRANAFAYAAILAANPPRLSPDEVSARALASKERTLEVLRRAIVRRGVLDTARRASIPRGSIYRVIGEGGNPSLFTFAKLVEAAGLKLELGGSYG